MQEVIEKLKDILASEGKRDLKTKDIAKELGIHPDTFNSMKFRNSIPYPQILNFLNGRNISINYFFYGSSALLAGGLLIIATLNTLIPLATSLKTLLSPPKTKDKTLREVV